MASTLIGKLLIGTLFDDKGIASGVKKGKKHLSTFQRSTQSISKSITKSLGSIGAGLAIGSLITNAASSISNFEQKVANLASTTGKSTDSISALIQNAKDVGAVSSFSASEVIELQTELAKLGNNEADIISMTKSVGDFSVAVGASAADAATLAGGVLKSFNIDARNTESVVSSLAVATTKSALDFNKLNVALPIVGTAADQMGFSVERTTSLLGVLSDRNIDASTSGTALRNIFLDLKAKGLTYEEAMSQINGSTDKLNTANELFGKRGAVVATVLAESGVAADRLEASITGVDGALKTMTDTRLDTVQGKVTLLTSAWNNLILSVDSGDGVLSNAFKGVVEFATDFVKDLKILNDEGLEGLSRKGAENLAQSGRDRITSNLTVASRGLTTDTLGNQKSSLEKVLIGLNAALKDTVPQSEEYNQVLKDITVTQEKLDKLNFNPFKNITSSAGGGDAPAKVQTFSDKIKALEEDISRLSETYIEGGSTDEGILATIKDKAQDLGDLNAKLKETETLVSKAFGRGVTAPAALSSGIGDQSGLLAGDRADSGQSVTSGAANVNIDPEYIQRSIDQFTKLNEVIDDGSLKTAYLGEVMASTAVTMAQSLGNSLAEGAASFASFATSALGSIKKVIGGLIQQYVATYLLEALKGTGLLGVVAAPVIGGLAAGIFNTAISSAVPALAEGGVVSGPRIVQVGEYAGASSNPEIIAPEKKLTSIFSGVLARQGGGGSTEIYGRLDGSDMLLSNTRQGRVKKRTAYTTS